MSLRNIVLETFTGLAIAGLTACGSSEESNIAKPIVSVPVANVKYSAKKPCEILLDEKGRAHVAEPTEGHVCIGDYQVEIPALLYLVAVERMNPGMPKTEIIKYSDLYGNNNGILETPEIAPLADKRLMSNRK